MISSPRKKFCAQSRLLLALEMERESLEHLFDVTLALILQFF